jgi:hypothetical protein
MRRYWTGTTEQSMPRAAPRVWPMPCHQDLWTIDREELIAAKRSAGQVKRYERI